MNYDQFIDLICEGEGKKVEVTRGNVKEVWKVIKAIARRNPISVVKLLFSK